ncbi:MAG: FAD-dependent oxidoreductase [Bdellovibrionota bacterium]
MKQKQVVILGAGITGLSAARALAQHGFDVRVFEKEKVVGGLARYFNDEDGFIYDNGPRFIFSTLAEKIGIAEICKPIKYYENIYVKGRTYQFPLGFIKNPWYCLTVGLSMVARKFKKPPTNLEEFLYTYYGKTLSKDVLTPLIEKWAGIKSKDISIDFAFRLLPTSIRYILYSLIKKLRGGKTEDYYKKSRYIVYPQGGNKKIFDALLSEPGIHLTTGAILKSIDCDEHKVTKICFEGQTLEPDFVISTIPLSSLQKSMNNKDVFQPYQNLRYRAIVILFIKLNKPKALDALWDWYPDPQFSFYRIAEYKNADANLAPQDRTLISIEFACEASDPLTRSTPQELYEEVATLLAEKYNIGKDDVLSMKVEVSSFAYPILQKSTEDLHRSIGHTTKMKNLFLAGRTGAFQYRMTEGCFQSAMDCVDLILSENENDSPSSSLQHDFSDQYGRPNAIPE